MTVDSSGVVTVKVRGGKILLLRLASTLFPVNQGFASAKLA